MGLIISLLVVSCIVVLTLIIHTLADIKKDVNAEIRMHNELNRINKSINKLKLEDK